MEILAAIADHIQDTLPCFCKVDGNWLLIDPEWVGEFVGVGQLEDSILYLDSDELEVPRDHVAIDLAEPDSINQLIDHLRDWLRAAERPLVP